MLSRTARFCTLIPGGVPGNIFFVCSSCIGFSKERLQLCFQYFGMIF